MRKNAFHRLQGKSALEGSLFLLSLFSLFFLCFCFFRLSGSLLAPASYLGLLVQVPGALAREKTPGFARGFLERKRENFVRKKICLCATAYLVLAHWHLPVGQSVSFSVLSAFFSFFFFFLSGFFFLALVSPLVVPKEMSTDL